MNIIIATSSTDFAKMLKNSFEQNDVNVLEIVTCLEDLIDALTKKPKLDAILLKTDLAVKGNDMRLEVLSDSLLSIRTRPEFENLVFTVLSDYSQGHPLLAELFEMGIYNFFQKNGKEFTVKNLIDSFEKPMSFSLSVKYRNADPSIPWRRNLSKPQTYRVSFENAYDEKEQKPKEVSHAEVIEEEVEITESLENERKPFKMPSLKMPNISLPKVGKKRQVGDDAQFDDLEVSKNPTDAEQPTKDEQWVIKEPASKSITTPKVIGTVVIAVTSVRDHLGSTNTAMSIAAYLKEQGQDVALVEANKSMDFDRMHSLIEGEVVGIDAMEFELKGIPHFKYREGFDIGRIYQLYKYVVLDMGILEDSPYKDEFFRSHIKCIVASGDEWKFYWIEEFLLKNDVFNPIFLLPSADKEIATDVSSRLKNKYLVQPVFRHDSPYIVSNETAAIYSEILSEFESLTDFTGKANNKFLIALIAIGAFTIVILIGIIGFLL